MNQNERKGHLLIVDDTVENLKVLGIILKDKGYRITDVHNTSKENHDSGCMCKQITL